ncbi:MAG TPA: alpha/beta fold hydrolase [Vicinamibacterales bacterium]|nr:alpha/beta fold hydrolase [Vicinamibacterales bacterium]
MNDFIPRRGLTNGHLMTLFAWARPRGFDRLPAPEARCFDTEADTRVLAHCHWQPDRSRHPLLLALHGLEGSSSAHYMRGLADKAFGRGFNVILLNQRNCGGTEALCPGLYHSGLTADARHVIGEVAAADGIDRIVAAGYSLGGNLALKLAGEYGDAPPPQLRGVCAISPVIELGRCVDALDRRSNLPYQLNFVRALRARMRRKSVTHPGRFDVQRLRGVWTVRKFDDVFTAPYFGFHGAADYYHRASAMRVVDRVRVPALIITAEDDPFVPTDPFRDPKITANPNITLKVTEHGGHCGFVAAATAESDGYWAEEQIVEFADRLTAARPA